MKREHVIEEVNYRAPGPSTEAPTTCTCGWEGPASAYAQHRVEAIAADAAAAKEGRSVTTTREPTDKQEQAWRLVADEGLTQVEAAEQLGISQAGVQSRLRGYMGAKGIKGPLPGYGAGNGPVTVRHVEPEPAEARPQPDELPTTAPATETETETETGDARVEDPAPDTDDGAIVAPAVHEGGRPSVADAIAAEIQVLDGDIERTVAEAERLATRARRLQEARERLSAAHEALVAIETAA
jgi:hypothetical protein